VGGARSVSDWGDSGSCHKSAGTSRHRHHSKSVMFCQSSSMGLVLVSRLSVRRLGREGGAWRVSDWGDSRVLSCSIQSLLRNVNHHQRTPRAQPAPCTKSCSPVSFAALWVVRAANYFRSVAAFANNV
jgi:hypothetical protein